MQASCTGARHGQTARKKTSWFCCFQPTRFGQITAPAVCSRADLDKYRNAESRLRLLSGLDADAKKQKQRILKEAIVMQVICSSCHRCVSPMYPPRRLMHRIACRRDARPLPCECEMMVAQLTLLCVARLSDACTTRVLAPSMLTNARSCTAPHSMAFRKVYGAFDTNVDSNCMVQTLDALALRGMHAAAARGVRSQPPVCLAKPVKSSYYKRPAAALERGGGFYIPGLEGYRLRLLVGSVLSAALVANRIASPDASISQFFSEGLGGFSCLLLFIQVAADRAAEEDDRRELARAIATSRMEERQQVDAQLDARVAEHAEWVARALLRLLPTDVVMLLDGEAAQTIGEHEATGVLLRFGRFEPTQQPAVSEIVRSMTSSQEQDILYLPEINSKRDAQLGLPSNTGSAVMVCCGGQRVLVVCSQRSDAFSEKHLRYACSLARSMQLKFERNSE